jgi:hypothetical protein
MAPEHLLDVLDGHDDPSPAQTGCDGRRIERHPGPMDYLDEHLDHGGGWRSLGRWHRNRLSLSSTRHLRRRPCRLPADVQVLLAQGLAVDAVQLYEVKQGVVYPHAQSLLKLLVSPAIVGFLDHVLDGRLQSSMAGEENALVHPEVVLIELRDVGERVVASCVVVARQVTQRGQIPEEASAGTLG